MFGIGLIEVLALLLVVVGLVGLLLRASSGRRPLQVATAREWRLVQATRIAGLVVGVAAAVLVTQVLAYGGGAMLAPAVLGLCVLLATAVGETVVRPAPAPGPRSASLTPRRVRDYLPPVLTPVVAVMLALTAATLVLTTVTASLDEGTGTMRALSCSDATSGASRSPYPGSYYSLPLTLTLLVVLAVAVVAALQVVRRPRGMAGTDHGDDALRRRSLGVIVAATGLAVCAPLAGIALLGGSALVQLPQQSTCAPSWMGWTGTALLVLGPAALVVTCACLLRLLSGTPDRAPETESPVAR